MCPFVFNVTPGGDNIYGHNDYYADAFRKPRWSRTLCADFYSKKQM